MGVLAFLLLAVVSADNCFTNRVDLSACTISTCNITVSVKRDAAPTLRSAIAPHGPRTSHVQHERVVQQTVTCPASYTDSDDDGVVDCLDACPSNPDLQRLGPCGCVTPTPLGLPAGSPKSAIAAAIDGFVQQFGANPAAFPVVVNWRIPFPINVTSLLNAAILAPVSNGPPPFRFNLAGGLLTQTQVLFFSACEYLLDINSPVQAYGFGGTYYNTEFFDWVVAGSVADFTETDLDGKFFQTGDTFATPASPTGRSIEYGFGPRGGQLLERALFSSPIHLFSLVGFGIAPVTLSQDFKNSYETLCTSTTSVLMNLLSLTWAQVLFGAPCSALSSNAAFFGNSVCGYSVYDLLQQRFPGQAAAVVAKCGASALPPVNLVPVPASYSDAFQQLVATFQQFGQQYAQVLQSGLAINPCKPEPGQESLLFPIKNVLYPLLQSQMCPQKK